MSMTQVEYPVLPAITKPRGTLLDAATVVDKFKWLDGQALFESYNGLNFDGDAFFCSPNAKDLDQQAGWMDGFRFAAYGGVTCKLVGLEEQDEGVREAFENGETVAVERALMKHRFIANAAGGTDESADATTPNLPGEWEEPEDITPAGGAVTVAQGIALLEEKAGDLYVGAPTLHIPRSAASLLVQVSGAEFEGDVLRTKLGSKIAAGAGYAFPNTGPDGVAAPAGERWLYASGEVFLGRGALEVRTNFNTITNEIVTLAERPYIAAIDTFVVAIRVNVGG